MQSRPMLAAAAALLALAPHARADAEPTTAPAAAVSPQDLVADIRATEKQFSELFPTPAALADSAKRTQSGAQGAILLKKIAADIDSLALAKPAARTQIEESRRQYDAILVALGDAGTKSALEQQAQGTGPEALAAKRTLVLGQWYAAGRDAAAQGGLVTSVEALGQANPGDIPTTLLAVRLSHQAATPELAKRLTDLVEKTMKNPAADQFAAGAAAAAKLKANEGKPMVLAGTTVEGKPFTTADYKGKVVLVDFWATWCGPCKAELPKVKQLYADYHGKGLEIVGVSNDYAAAELKTFVAQESMPWPQLFDAAAAADHSWNPTTLGFGIDGIPTMFLIDKKGVCRTVEARQNYEDLIPKLLAE